MQQVDSNGRQLSEGQQEYFKDSKLRDKDGRLLTIYHGTDAEFYTFDPRQFNEKNGRTQGFGIYLTSDKTLAAHYGDRIIEGYANITKPAYGDRKTIKLSEIKRLVKDHCMWEAKRLVEDDGYNSIDEALRDTWISNYVNTYGTSLENAYAEVADIVYSGNENDVDMIYEIMNGSGIANYQAAMDFYDEVLTPSIGVDGLWYSQNDGSVVALAFDSHQIKNVDNVNPTSKEDIRWSEREGDAVSDAELLAGIDAGSIAGETGKLLAEYQSVQKKLRNARRRLLNETRKLQGQNVEDETSISVRQFRQDAINLFSIPEGQRKELGTELREIGQRIASGELVAYEEQHELFEKLLDAGRVAPDNGGEVGTERSAAA